MREVLNMEGQRFSEAIVIGAGPAGLGASIGLARQGVGVTVLEQQDTLGSVRRGETIRANEDMEEILGKDFFDRITRWRVSRRRYYSHSGRCHVDRTISNPNIIFDWPELIRVMAQAAEESGARILKGSCVVRLIDQGERVEGVVANIEGSTHELMAGTILSCGGYNDPASRHIGLDRSHTDKPTSKMLVRGYRGPDDRLEYHFHIGKNGLVVGTIFPRGAGEAEIILLDTAGSGEGLSFEEFSRIHPIFRERLDGTEAFYKLETFVPMGGMLYPFSPRAGLIMAGDALGHVQARGGSGIRTSFLIGHTAGTLAADVMRSGGWTDENRMEFEKAMRSHPHVKSLKMHNLIFSNLRSRIFKGIKTPKDMDRFWPLLKMALR
jgi:flavin-dependent dehydrogenase